MFGTFVFNRKISLLYSPTTPSAKTLLAVILPQKMGNCSFEIQIETEDKLKFLICDDYWHLNKNRKYTYYVKDIAYKYNISMIEVTEIASKNSKFITKCINCKNIINQFIKRSDFSLDDFFNSSIYTFCEECKLEIERLKNERNQNITQIPKIIKPFDVGKKFQKMENSFQEKIWRKINEMELETLIQIIESENNTEVFQKIFYNNKEIGGSYRQKIWTRVNRLEELDLIWVERNIENKITEFHFLDKLKSQLKLEYPELFIN